jgi:hypothetical protein
MTLMPNVDPLVGGSLLVRLGRGVVLGLLSLVADSVCGSRDAR